MSEQPRRVLLVEDHAVLSDGLAIVLSRAGHEVRKVGGGRPAADVVAEAEDFRPDVVLLDLHLGEPVGDSVSLVPLLTRTGAEVVILTAETDPSILADCLEAGAAGVAMKSASLEHIMDLVVAASDGCQVMSAHDRSELLAAARRQRAEVRQRLAPFGELSRREAEVLDALTKGESAEQVAADSYVSIWTVRSQIRAILRKLGVASQLQAVAMARSAGWESRTPPRCG